MNTATSLFSLCSTRRAYLSFLILLLLSFSQVGKGQVGTYSSIKLQGRERYNYVSGRVVYHFPREVLLLKLSISLNRVSRAMNMLLEG